MSELAGWAVRLEVLHVPDCPNLSPLLERLAQVTDLPVVTRVIESDEDAARLGMTGSPTLLVDGVDLFGVAGEGGLWCRVSVPPVEQLRAAITGLHPTPKGAP
ncbi:hypothetical protein [Kribbella antiqua]|nr:hypothetical protein [Kribbella antiqua]